MSNFINVRDTISLLDKNGDKPELFLLVSRTRGLGKTYGFTKFLMDKFSEDGSKFVLFCRWGRELGSVASGMFKSMLSDHYKNMWVEEKIKGSGTYSIVTLCSRDVDEDGNDIITRQECGYVIPINAADAIKRVSSTFSDSVHAFFDEFQPENRQSYVTDEVEKFKSIHTSIARGGGESRRYYPVFFSSNAVSMSNPYFLAMRLHTQIQPDTKLFRGDGFVYRRAESSEISAKHDSSPMSRAMPGLRSSHFGDDGWFMDDNEAVCKPDKSWGQGNYVATIVYENKEYGVYIYHDCGLCYISHTIDSTYPRKLRITIEGKANLPLLRTDPLGPEIRARIMSGQMRYQSLNAKNIAYEFLV